MGIARTEMFASVDGAEIAYLTLGEGPPVIIVPGSLSVASNYIPFAAELARRFRVHILERRGRGPSAPQDDRYDVALERDDALALQALTGARFIVGHSFGGLVAIEAALKSPSIAGIAVYEPAVCVNGAIFSEWIPRYEGFLQSGKFMDALAHYVRATGPSRARKTPHWLMKTVMKLAIPAQRRRQMMALLPENLREHRAVTRHNDRCDAYAAVSARMLLMYGGKSDLPWLAPANSALQTHVRDIEVQAFPNLDHLAIEGKGAVQIAGAVAGFFQAI